MNYYYGVDNRRVDLEIHTNSYAYSHVGLALPTQNGNHPRSIPSHHTQERLTTLLSSGFVVPADVSTGFDVAADDLEGFDHVAD